VAAANVTTTDASIIWSTNQPSSSEVEYGTTASYGTIVAGQSGVTEHIVTLTDLAPGTTYHFRVRSANSQNQTGTSANFVFTTAELPTPDPGPPPQEAHDRVEQIVGRRPQIGQTKLDAQRQIGATMPGRAVNVRDVKAAVANTGTSSDTKSASGAVPKSGAEATSGPTTLRPSACVTPDPFSHLPGLVGVCQRGVWIPVVRR
jgi:hypothetical protein